MVRVIAGRMCLDGCSFINGPQEVKVKLNVRCCGQGVVPPILVGEISQQARRLGLRTNLLHALRRWGVRSPTFQFGNRVAFLGAQDVPVGPYVKTDPDLSQEVTGTVELHLNLWGDEPLRFAFDNVELSVFKLRQDVGHAVGTTNFLQIQWLRLPAPDESKYPQVFKDEHRSALMATICIGDAPRPSHIDRVPGGRLGGFFHIDAGRRVKDASTPCFGGCLGVVSAHFDAPSVTPKAGDASHTSR